ncbi:MAG: hypothetical protein ACRD3H_14780, partial [Terriglobales bacterium]
TMLARSNPETARALLRLAQDDVHRQWGVYANRAAMSGDGEALDGVISEPASPSQQTLMVGEEK